MRTHRILRHTAKPLCAVTTLAIAFACSSENPLEADEEDVANTNSELNSEPEDARSRIGQLVGEAEYDPSVGAGIDRFELPDQGLVPTAVNKPSWEQTDTTLATGGSLWEYSAAILPPFASCAKGLVVFSGSNNGGALVVNAPVNCSGVPPTPSTNGSVRLNSCATRFDGQFTWAAEADSVMVRTSDLSVSLARGSRLENGPTTADCEVVTPVEPSTSAPVSGNEEISCRSGTAIHDIAYNFIGCQAGGGGVSAPQVGVQTPVDPDDVSVQSPGSGKFSQYRAAWRPSATTGVEFCGWYAAGWDREEILHDPSGVTFLAMNGRAGKSDTGCGPKYNQHLLFSSADGFATTPQVSKLADNHLGAVMMTSTPNRYLYMATCEGSAVKLRVHAFNVTGAPVNQKIFDIPGVCSHSTKSWNQSDGTSRPQTSHGVARVYTSAAYDILRVHFPTLENCSGCPSAMGGKRQVLNVRYVRVNHSSQTSITLGTLTTPPWSPVSETDADIIQATSVEPSAGGDGTSMLYWRRVGYRPVELNPPTQLPTLTRIRGILTRGYERSDSWDFMKGSGGTTRTLDSDNIAVGDYAKGDAFVANGETYFLASWLETPATHQWLCLPDCTYTVSSTGHKQLHYAVARSTNLSQPWAP